MPASVSCATCQDNFCAPCYRWIHRKGSRTSHPITPLHQNDASLEALHREDAGTTDSFIKMLQETQARLESEEALKKAQQEANRRLRAEKAPNPLSDSISPVVGSTSIDAADAAPATLSEVMDDEPDANQDAARFDPVPLSPPSPLRSASDEDPSGSSESFSSTSTTPLPVDTRLLERYRYIPLRLSADERTLLQLVERTMDVSEYTDKVDVSSDYFGYRVGPKDQVIKRELEDVFSILSGLYASCDFRAGKRFVSGRTFADNQDFFATVFEVARRFKITNPDKLRSTYGKLMHLLQDAVTPGQIDVACKLPIKTVWSLLKEVNDFSLLADPDIVPATTHIEATPGESRESLMQRETEKREARTRLIEKYSPSLVRPSALAEADIERIIDSIADSNTYIAQNRHPVDRMIDFLKQHFSPDREGSLESSLQINYGYEGSKLSHSHSTQFVFVLQSLKLWREIQHEMYRLWICSDRDLLEERSPYRLRNTGQGLNRVQGAPSVSNVMSEILGRVQMQVRSRGGGGWVGLSVVHLGDRDVPNALVFIDKYTQVPRILAPIVKVLDAIDDLGAHDPLIRRYLDQRFGGPEHAKTTILRDFFRHGFNGSGSDGGSCIDGRLTSAWNWCSKLDKKPYKYLFMLSGFQGFDGNWKG